MKKFLLTAILLAFANTSFALDAYVGVHGGSVNHDEALYSINTSQTGASIGVTQNLGETPFFVLLEGFATEHQLSPAVGLGIKAGDFTISAGASYDNEERATKVFGGQYANGTSTDEFNSKFVEVSGYNIFVRYSEYDVNHNFVGANKANPFGAPAILNVSDKNSIINIGYRHTF